LAALAGVIEASFVAIASPDAARFLGELHWTIV